MDDRLVAVRRLLQPSDPVSDLTCLTAVGFNDRFVAEHLLRNYSWEILTNGAIAQFSIKIGKLMYRFGRAETWIIRPGQFAKFIARLGPRPRGRTAPWKFVTAANCSNTHVNALTIVELSQPSWRGCCNFRMNATQIFVELDGITIGTADIFSQTGGILMLTTIRGSLPRFYLDTPIIHHAAINALVKHMPSLPKRDWLAKIQLICEYSTIGDGAQIFNWIIFMRNLPDECVDWLLKKFGRRLNDALTNVVQIVSDRKDVDTLLHLNNRHNLNIKLDFHCPANKSWIDMAWQGKISPFCRDNFNENYNFYKLFLKTEIDRRAAIDGIIAVLQRRFYRSRKTTLRRLADILPASRERTTNIFRALWLLI